MADWLRTFGHVSVRYTHRVIKSATLQATDIAAGVEDAAELESAGGAEAGSETKSVTEMDDLAIVLVLYEPEDFDEQRRMLGRAVREAWHLCGRPATGTPKIALSKGDRARVRLRAEFSRLPGRTKPPGFEVPSKPPTEPSQEDD
jgi:hypothetical protein